MFRGWLAIPYMRRSPWRGWSVASIRFRRLDEGSPKYMTVAGDKPRLYNTAALTLHTDRIVVCEGELDAITAHLCGVPAVGVPGVQTWQPHYRELFLGCREVLILTDGDEPGLQFGNTVAKALSNAKVIPMPAGKDVNSLVIEQGKQALLERIK
jgi:DNA primase